MIYALLLAFWFFLSYQYGTWSLDRYLRYHARAAWVMAASLSICSASLSLRLDLAPSVRNLLQRAINDEINRKVAA
jgi:hypothetical protein